MSFNWPIGPSRRPDDYVSDDEVSYDGKWDDWESDTSGEADMEEEDPSAFPFYKPDRDVFWPQSGWYQIKRRYAIPYIPPTFAVVGSSASNAPTSATPASVPLELHDLIADSLSLDSGLLIGANAGYFSRNHAIMSKSEMTRCALVCSSWALKCQPHLFKTVTLRSRQDLLTLLGFLDSSLSRVSQFIQYIEVPEQRLDTMPWLHLISRLYPRLRCEEFSLAFRLRGPLHTKYRTMHSIHYLLPRVNPSTASLNVAALWLSDISIHSLGDLVQIIGEMPHLRNLHCTNVSWATVPRVWTSLKITTNRAKHFEIWMAGCTDNNAAAWMFVALRRQRRESPSEDLELMYNLTGYLGSAITADAEAASALTVAVDNHIVRSGERTDIGYAYASVVSPREPKDEPIATPEARYQWKMLPSLDGGVVGRLTRAEFTLWDRRYPETSLRWRAIDWERTSDTLECLPSLHEVVFAFLHKDDASEFSETIVQRHAVLKRLLENDKLRVTSCDPSR